MPISRAAISHAACRRLDKLLQAAGRKAPHQLNHLVVQNMLVFTHQYVVRKIATLTRDLEFNEHKARGKGGTTTAAGLIGDALPKLLELAETISAIDLQLVTAKHKIASKNKKQLEIQLLQHKFDQLRAGRSGLNLGGRRDGKIE